MLSDQSAAFSMPPSPGIPPGLMSLPLADVDLFLQSEARFRALAQATGQIYWVADTRGYLTDSTSWRAFTGQSAEEVAGNGWAAALHPEDRECVLVDWTTALATGQPYRRQHRVRRADGSYRVMLAQAYPVLAPDGTISEWVGVDTDITQLLELRAEVQTSQEEFRATFEQAAVGMAHVGLADGRLLRVNRKFCEILGYSQEEMLHHTFQDLTFAPDLGTNLALFEQMLTGKLATYTLEKRYIRKDGSLVWVNLTASFKRNQAGKPEYGIAVIKDISARKAAEKALRQSEQQYHQLFETMAQGVIYYSASGKVLSANPAALRMLGVTRERLQQLTALDPGRRVVFEDGSRCPSEGLPTMRALRTGQTVSDVMGVFNYQEKAYRWLQVTAIPEFRPGEQTPYRVFATFEDISERRRLEEELSKRVQELEAIFSSMNDGVVVVGSDGRVLSANPAYESLFGWPAGSALYTMSLEERHRALHIRDARGQLISLDQIQTSRILRGEVITEEQICRRRDGSDVVVIVQGAPLTDATGSVIGAVLVFHNITERRRLEQQTQEALKALLRMAELLVQQPQAEEQQRSLEVERHLAELACSLLGCPVAFILTLDPQTLGMRVLATVGYASEQEEQLHAIISNWTHTPPALAHMERLMAGETLVLDLTQPPYQQYAALFGARQAIAAPMLLSSGLIGMIVFNPNEITKAFTEQQIALAGATAQLVGLVVERERLMREREEARASALSLREANRQLDTFLGLASHELRIPLTSMKLSLQLMRRYLDQARANQPAPTGVPAPAPLEPLLETAERQMGRLERLVKDLLNAARIKEDKLELRLEPIELVALVREVVAEQRQLMPERVIQLHVPADQTFVVQADGDRIRQAVTNYLTNALKYSPECAPVVVGVEQEGEQARVWVRDQGPGIPLAEQKRLWERFHRVPGIREQHGPRGGLGLGLYITRMLIKQHQGQVGMSSTPGQGATFWLTLPARAL